MVAARLQLVKAEIMQHEEIADAYLLTGFYPAQRLLCFSLRFFPIFCFCFFFVFFFGGSSGRLSGLCCKTWSACIIIIIIVVVIVVVINQGEVWKPVDDVRGNRKHTEPCN